MNRLAKIRVLVFFTLTIPAFVLAGSNQPPGPFQVCFDFSCKNSQQVNLNQSDWKRVEALFYLSGDAAEERQRIKQAIAVTEELVGNYTPTHRDVARNWPVESSGLADLPGQMDCIDESINTLTYLRLIEDSGLLKFHNVLGRAYRRSLLQQHWAAEIAEINSGQTYIVDSWFEDNGELPVLVRGETWRDLGW